MASVGLTKQPRHHTTSVHTTHPPIMAGAPAPPQVVDTLMHQCTTPCVATTLAHFTPKQTNNHNVAKQQHRGLSALFVFHCATHSCQNQPQHTGPMKQVSVVEDWLLLWHVCGGCGRCHNPINNSNSVVGLFCTTATTHCCATPTPLHHHSQASGVCGIGLS